ncbi:unnamed protein product [Caenorhabditis bovis]|uniref:Uncharacterized protein n=1 Tax=Caenorhabditis bovis TaxID=2654633 RepID=A0A8S1EZ98_9PELO|nr:unnamed protein product [Caenorhabditis bovis]
MPSSCRLLIIAAVASVIVGCCLSAPTVCRACTKNCFASNSSTNATSSNVDLMNELEMNEIDDSTGRRHKREVEFRACSRFQIEMLLIPMAIALIPLVLCALFVCTCCCGPKESQSKLPDDFLASLPMSKKRSAAAPEEIELEFGNGYVARKDSSRTKFSTTVSYIEARRESIWSATSVASDTAAEAVKHDSMKAERDEPAKLTKAKSCESIKRCRFSDTVSVISVDSLNRR